MADFPTIDYSITFKDSLDQVIYAKAKDIISKICPNYPGGMADKYKSIVDEILRQFEDYSQFEITGDQVEKVVLALYNKWWDIFVQEVNQDNFWWGGLGES